MGELILHIGTRKTGTTALQNFFFDNREVLLKNGVDYIQFTPQKTAPHAKRNGIFLSEYCRALSLKEDIDNHVRDFEENYNRLAESLKGNNRVLISDENFSNFSIKRYDGQYNPERYWQDLYRTIKELEPEKITIIIYLRRQDEYVISSWKERVNRGWTDKPFSEYLNHADRKHELDYRIMLDAVRNSFDGSAKIIVRSYNKVARSGADIFHDFCESLGIAWDSDYIIPEKRLNEAISYDMAEALLRIKFGGRGRSRDEKRVRKKLAVALCRNHPDSKGTTFFSAKEAKALVDMYSEGNRRIEEEYFDNKNLFSEEFNEGPIWHPNRFRITWYRVAIAVISIVSQMSLKTINVFKRMRRFINRLKDDRDAN